MSEPAGIQLATEVLQAEARAVSNVIHELDEAFNQAITLICSSGGSVIVSGVGKSGLVGQKISATLASVGTPSHFLHPTEAMHGDLGRIQANDVLLVLSHGGQTEEILALAALVQQDNVKVIAITGNRKSHLAELCDIHLCIGDVTEACPLNLAPTASTTAQLALGDALAMAVAQHRRFTAEDYRKRHPGGNLGRQMMPITDVLRFTAGHNLALIDHQLTVRQVLAEAATISRRAGAVLIVNDQGQLAGIFTDADLRRLLIRHGATVMDYPIQQVMTANPKRLKDSCYVRDAVQMVRETRLDEIPVVDDHDKPVGLIDVQDLIALKVIEG